MSERRYILDYNIGGETRSVCVWAKSWQDAEAHLDGIKQTGRIEGELVHEIPDWVVSIGLAAAWCWVQGWLHGQGGEG